MGVEAEGVGVLLLGMEKIPAIVDAPLIPPGKGIAREFITGEDVDPRTGKYVITDPVASLIVTTLKLDVIWNKVKELIRR